MIERTGRRGIFSLWAAAAAGLAMAAMPAAAHAEELRCKTTASLEPSKIEPVTFNYTGTEQCYKVPQGITLLYVELDGAPGGLGGGVLSSLGGKGGEIRGYLPVPATQRGLIEYLFVEVGGAGGGGQTVSASGSAGAAGGKGGYNGGGNGGSETKYEPSNELSTRTERGLPGGGGGGGGASDIQLCPLHVRTCGATLESGVESILVEAGGGGGGGGGGAALRFPKSGSVEE